ncbi:MAG: sulfurtransferase-like selenium metabolism protein YedF [Candidatus Stahlbacteria bacterium]|nr:sulfurtransferase-like selenium metabolism protein YedF [Candidatus Stahlbacteria bacterium]
MIKRIDARGLACPQPVVLAKKALDELESGQIEVIVDNKGASENVSRLARNLGCEVEVRVDGSDFIVKATKGVVSNVSEEEIVLECKDEVISPLQKTRKGMVVFIASDTIGSGSDELGSILMKVLFPTLCEVEPKPVKLIFMNSGVKLTVEGSEVLGSLVKLAKVGVELLICGTCLDYFGLKDKVKVGRVSNFYEITESLLKADKVIGM